jgi:TRAP-type mannitol/chloroaromatic compound transport system substrate-binding protein
MYQPFALAAAACTAVIVLLSVAAEAADKVRLNMVSALPLNSVLVGEGAPKFAKRVQRASGGTLEVKPHEPGAIVPALQSIQAVARGSVDAAWSPSGFFTGTDSVFALFTSVPFGPDLGEFLAWMRYGGGMELMNEMFGRHNIHAIPCGMTPPEASGWFRREIKSVQDLKGLKMRFFGFGAKVMEKFGVATQLLAPGDIFQALQLGTIDATEFAMPSMDLKLGFHQVAKYYYFPGWHQPTSMLVLSVNQKKWQSLSDQHKAILEQACGDTLQDMIAEGEATQWKAMKELRDKHGVKLMRWPPEMLKAMEKAWAEVAAEEAAKNPNFKRVHESFTKFRADYAVWREYGYMH